MTIISIMEKWNKFHSQQKSKTQVLGCNFKNDRMILVHFQGKPFNIIVIQVYAPTTEVKETEIDWFYEGLQYFLELTPKKMSFRRKGLCSYRTHN